MPSTFIELTNTLLRRLNEVEIAEADFPGARGVQALAKDAIRSSIAKINQAEYSWPFNAAEHTQVLAVGQEEYSWPQFYKVADWNSFQIQGSSSLNIDHTTLDFISRDEYYVRYRDLDDDAGIRGRGIPQFVFPAHGNGYGVSPSPDQAYTLKFRYFMNYNDLQLFSDQTRIPETYDNVIIEGALYHMYMFKDNPESAGVAAQIYQQGIKEMQGILINQYTTIRDTRILRNRRFLV
jgi:hypothetical protein